MHDVFPVGSMVIIDKVNSETIENIQVGDIIQYRFGDITIVHRVVEIKYDSYGEKEYITKGDNNPEVDTFPVKPSQVVGFARWWIPYIGYPALMIASLK